MKYLPSFILIILLVSCAQVTSLNLKKHQFGSSAQKVIWLQIAGLDEEHISLTKFDKSEQSAKSSFESFLCYGKAWEYNLYNIRPEARMSLMSQVTGSKRVNGTCEDYTLEPIWQYLKEDKYEIGVVEHGVDETEALDNENCKASKKFLDSVTHLKLVPAKNEKVSFFHAEDNNELDPGQKYYDKSCFTGKCFTELSKNIKSIFNRNFHSKPKFLFLLRDFSYQKALKSGNITKAKSILIEIEKMIEFFDEYLKGKSDTLLLMTSAQAQNIQLPKQGKQWVEYVQKAKVKLNPRSRLMSSVMAKGAKAENFCGLYNQNEILDRMFSGAEQQGLELKFINPFKR